MSIRWLAIQTVSVTTNGSPALNDEARSLLHEIARCPVMHDALGGRRNPCSKVVAAQGAPSEKHHLPEPWNGDLERAPILFISSNPSVNAAEHYPDDGWSNAQVEAYFAGRFGGEGAPIRRDGRTHLRDKTYSRKSVPFLNHLRNRAKEILGHDPVPGVDYALAEVVRCKSANQQGVKAAVTTCADLYLERTLACSGARVMVVYGDVATNAMALRYQEIDPDRRVQGPIDISGDARMVALLPHPGSGRGPKFFDPAESARLRTALVDHSA